MQFKIPLLLITALLLIVFIFNIASLGVTDWFVAEDKQSGVTQTYKWGLLEYEACTKATGFQKCTSSKYEDVNTAKFTTSQKRDLEQTQAGGGLALAFLVINVITTALLLFVCILMIFEVLTVISKNGLLVSLFPWYPIIILPFQVFALFWWAVLFGFYDFMDDFSNQTIGAGVGLLIVSIILPIIVFVVNKVFFKQSNNVTSM